MTPCTVPGVTLACNAVGSVAGAAVTAFAQAMAGAEAEMLKLVLTAWLGIPTPSLSGKGSTVTFLQSHLEWYTGVALAAGLMVAAMRLMLEMKGEALRESAYALVRTVIVIGCGAAGIALATAAGDHFSTWIVGQAAGGATATSVLTSAANLEAASAIAPGILIVLGFLGVVGMLIQIAMLLCRSAFLVILSGVWPFAAALSTTESGLAWYRRLTGWIVAFILFKPTAAIIYAAAIRMLVVNQGSEISVIEGVVLVILAALALPALMKLVAPMTGRMGGIAAAEFLAAGIGVAAGAAMLAGTGGLGAAAGGGEAAGSVGGGAAGPVGLAGDGTAGGSGTGGGAAGGGGITGDGGPGDEDSGSGGFGAGSGGGGAAGADHSDAESSGGDPSGMGTDPGTSGRTTGADLATGGGADGGAEVTEATADGASSGLGRTVGLAGLSRLAAAPQRMGEESIEGPEGDRQ
jgi:hypothetical protein